jgi:osmotically-inducible protein OsmY
MRIRLSAAMAVAGLALLAGGGALSGCVVVAAGGGAVAGYAVLAEDLSPEQQMRDYGVKAEVQAAWGNFNQELAHRLDATVFDGQVLITGRVPDRRWREEAVRRAHDVGGVRRVIDQMETGPDTHFIDSAKDTWITTQLRGELVADVDVKSINYSIKTADRVVYILGVARSQVELDKVIGHARTIAGVRRVTPFVQAINAPGERDVNGPPPGQEDTLPPDDDGDETEAAPPQPNAPAYAPPPARGTIKAESLP